MLYTVDIMEFFRNNTYIVTLLRISILLWNIFVVWYASVRLSVFIPESEALGVYLFIPALLSNCVQIALFSKLPKRISALLNILVVPLLWVLLFSIFSGSVFSDFVVEAGIIALIAAAVNLFVVIFGLILSGFLDKTGDPQVRKRKGMILYLPIYLLIMGLSMWVVVYGALQWFAESTYIGLLLVLVSVVHQCIVYYSIVKQIWQQPA